MLKRVVHSLGLLENTDKNPKRKSKVRGAKTPPDFGLRSKDLYVRIVHQGGQQEVHHHAFPASKLMAKYPGMCVARAQVFMAPHHSVLTPEEHLLLGHKYVIISCRDVEKLKRKQHGKTKEHNEVVTLEPNIVKSTRGHKSKENDKVNENGQVKEAKGLGEEKVSAAMNVSHGGGDVEEVHFSAKDFYVAKDTSARYSRRKGIKAKKPFLPPLPEGGSYRGLGWQPNLATVQELSP